MDSKNAAALLSANARIVVRGVNWLGDAVMTTPALQQLRTRFPKASITLLTHEKLAGLYAAHPCLDSVLTFAAKESVWSIGRRLRAEKFDQAIILPNSPRSALESWLARIPPRRGYARTWRRWLLTQALPSRPGHIPMHNRTVTEIRQLVQSQGDSIIPASIVNQERCSAAHQIFEYLHLTAALGASPASIAPSLHVTPEELDQARTKWLAGLPLNSGEKTRPLLGINPGAEYGPAKRWPAENFAAAARIIMRQTGCACLLFGGPHDAPICASIVKKIEGDVVNLAGQTNLRELMSLLKLCDVLLTNDTGPMHLAAALGTFLVVPFGSTSPELTGPGLPGSSMQRLLRVGVACSPCFQRTCPIDLRCLIRISPDLVAAEVIAVLRKN
jgi:heptosyltransferase II